MVTTFVNAVGFFLFTSVEKVPPNEDVLWRAKIEPHSEAAANVKNQRSEKKPYTTTLLLSKSLLKTH